MKTITFTCQTITPMFLAGADPTRPELRPPSIKGALRFWWRAMHGHLSLPQLKKQEASIFGGSGDKQGRSKVVVRVLRQPQKSNTTNTSPLPHKNNGKGGFRKDGIKEGFEFKVVLSTATNSFLSEGQLIALFKVVATLGGLGNRSRRGFGAFTITGIEKREGDKAEILSVDLPTSKENLLGLIKEVSPNFKWSETLQNRDFPYLKEVSFGENALDWKRLVTKIGNATHNVMGEGKDKFLYMNYVGNPNRFASPIYISAVKKGDSLFTVVSQLNTANDKAKGDKTEGEKRQEQLKETVLN